MRKGMRMVRRIFKAIALIIGIGIGIMTLYTLYSLGQWVGTEWNKAHSDPAPITQTYTREV